MGWATRTERSGGDGMLRGVYAVFVGRGNGFGGSWLAEDEDVDEDMDVDEDVDVGEDVDVDEDGVYAIVLFVLFAVFCHGLVMGRCEGGDG